MTSERERCESGRATRAAAPRRAGGARAGARGRSSVALAALAALGVLAGCPAKAEQEVKLASLDELKSLHEKEGKTPEGALKCWFIALYQFTSANADERARGQQGLSFLTIPLKDAADWPTRSSYATFVTRAKDPAFKHVFKSYAKGTSPQNGYAMDPNAFELDVVRVVNPGPDDRGAQLFVRSSGADSPRPVYMKQSTQTGLWYVNHFDNVYLDVRKPVDPSKETFK